MEKFLTFQVPVKPFWRSKIVQFCAATFCFFIGVYLTQNQVSPEQLNAISTAYPEIKQALQDYQRTNNLFAFAGAVAPAVISVIRVWFTKAVMPESLRNEK